MHSKTKKEIIRIDVTDIHSHEFEGTVQDVDLPESILNQLGHEVDIDSPNFMYVVGSYEIDSQYNCKVTNVYVYDSDLGREVKIEPMLISNVNEIEYEIESNYETAWDLDQQLFDCGSGDNDNLYQSLKELRLIEEGYDD